VIASYRRVHISATTASFLKGEFELEPGDGESREEGIKRAGIKTFLIKSVVKPVSIMYTLKPHIFCENLL